MKMKDSNVYNTMDSTPVTIFEADFDRSQLPPIDQKRMVAFVNHFVIDTAKFLNTFLVNCENKFVELESKLQKINAELLVIESKIFQGELKNPLPIEEILEETVEENESQLDADTVDQHTKSDEDSTVDNENDSHICDAELTNVTVCEDVRYEKYFKMKQFGVPAEAVKLKMSSEGLDSSMLDQPNRVLADGVRRNVTE